MYLVVLIVCVAICTTGVLSGLKMNSCVLEVSLMRSTAMRREGQVRYLPCLISDLAIQLTAELSWLDHALYMCTEC